jgi:hypothetical protein
MQMNSSSIALRTVTSLAALAASLAALTTTASALDVSRVQLGIAGPQSSSCPRQVTMKIWAHTNGPGVVKFVVRNASGIKSGQLSAQAVKGPAGNYLATYTRQIVVTTDVDTKYMAEVQAAGKVSNWVRLKGKCGPQPRKIVKTRGADTTPPVRSASDAAPKPRPKSATKTTQGGKPPARHASNDEPNGKAKPVGGGKPVGGSKPVAQCKSKKLSATRLSAASKKFGIGSAWTAWEHAARKLYGNAYAASHNAKSRKESCTWAGLYNCTVSATPCRS